MYAAIFVSSTEAEATVYTAPTQAQILSELRNWYARNLDDEERQFKPAPETASVDEISHHYADGCSGYFIQVKALEPIQALNCVDPSNS